MTDQQKQNVTNILRTAMEIRAVNKKEAVANGDFERSITIAANEARVEEYFRVKGVEIQKDSRDA